MVLFWSGRGVAVGKLPRDIVFELCCSAARADKRWQFGGDHEANARRGCAVPAYSRLTRIKLKQGITLTVAVIYRLEIAKLAGKAWRWRTRPAGLRLQRSQEENKLWLR